MALWKPAGLPFRPRSHAAVCWDGGDLHVIGGFHGLSVAAQGGQMLAESWRSADAMIAERSTASGLPPLGFCAAAATGGKIAVSTGYNGTLPPTLSAPDDQVSDQIFVSDDGGLTFTGIPQTVEPAECGTILPFTDSDGTKGWAVLGGLKYTWVNGGLTYQMTRHVYFVRASDLAVQVRQTNSPFLRRSFGAAIWNGKVTTYGGINDEASAAFHNDAWQFSDDLTACSQIATGQNPGSIMGHAAVVFKGAFVVLGGQWSGGNSQGVFYSTDANLQSWTRGPDLPFVETNGVWAAVMIKDGVEKLIVHAGRDASGAQPAVPGIYELDSLTGSWAALGASDLWGAA